MKLFFFQKHNSLCVELPAQAIKLLLHMARQDILGRESFTSQ